MNTKPEKSESPGHGTCRSTRVADQRDHPSPFADLSVFHTDGKKAKGSATLPYRQLRKVANPNKTQQSNLARAKGNAIRRYSN